jgi:AraC-like DNA-binding protein
MEIGLILSGSGEFYIENKHYDFKAEDIFLINKLEAHRAKTASNCLANSIFIYINNSLIDKYAQITSNVNLLKLTMLYGDNITNMFTDEKVSSIIKEIWSIHNSTNKYKNDIILAHVFNLLIHIYSKFQFYIEHNEIDHSVNYSILKAIDYINEHFNEKIYINDLSQICNLSQSYFSKKFKELLGKSPLDYILSRRLKNAYILIRDKNASASEAALLSGFDNYSNFLRKFKNEFNVNPVDLKRNTH